jgi:glycosyltransferase involved in cell wall biosynthesis
MNNWKLTFDMLYNTVNFDDDWYRLNYRDVSSTGLSPLEHYSKYGKALGRLPRAADASSYEKLFIDSEIPLVSIICITYNHEKFIAETIESILNQNTNFEYEILIGNDKSSDDTHQIIEKYARSSKKVRYFNRANNLGANANFVDLASRVRGKYVAICEGDDYWSSTDKLQVQVDFLTENPEYSICFHPVRVEYIDDLNRREFFPETKPTHLSFGGLLRSNFIQTNSVMYRWRFSQMRPLELDAKLAPGDWYIHLLHAEVGRIGYIDMAMAVYRKHSSGMWSSHENNLARFKKLGLNEIALFKKLEQRYGHLSLFDKAQYHIFSSLAEVLIEDLNFSALFELITLCELKAPDYLRKMGFRFRKMPNTIEELEAALLSASKVDVIVTAYNHEKYLARCLDGILSQKGAVDINIIIGDDNSTDGSAAIIDKYKKEFPDQIVVLERADNLGMLRNMKSCIDACKAPYIAFCEADDFWLSDRYLSKKVARMRRNPKVGMCFNWILLHLEESSSYFPHEGQGLLKDGRISFGELEETPLTANFSCCLYTREALRSVPKSFFERKLGADWLLNLYVASKYDIEFFREILSLYTIHPKGQWSGISADQRLKLENEFKNEFKHIFPNIRRDVAFKHFCVVVRDDFINKNPGILCFIDSPVDGSLVGAGSVLKFSGWVVSRDYKECSVVLRDKESYTEVDLDIDRADVIDVIYGKDSSDISPTCGFEFEIPLGDATYELDIVVGGVRIPWIKIFPR